MARSRHFILVVYDISNDKRRTRLHNVLCGFGTPVQYSVFECLLTDAELARMRERVRKAIRPQLDHVRLYFLCRECALEVEVSAGPPPARDEPCKVV
jgi:CRISPR-associated protein Cas2